MESNGWLFALVLTVAWLAALWAFLRLLSMICGVSI